MSDNWQGLKKDWLSGISVPKNAQFVVDQFQTEAIQAVTAGEDTLVVAPTGSGKTFIAIESIQALLKQRLRAVYTTPLKALSNSKYNDFKARFEPEYKVGILTGDRKIETEASLVVATTEIYRNELYRGASNFSLVVLDEVHYISDAQRGPVWEETIIFTPPSTTLLMLSASISNHQEIASWIEQVRGKKCRVVLHETRPVELRLGFLHPDYGAIPLTDPDGRILRPVMDYYGTARLDQSGMKIKTHGGGYRQARHGRSGPRRSKRSGGRR